MSGSGREPGSQRPWGVGAIGGAAGRWIGTGSGVSPAPWPRASRSFGGVSAAPDITSGAAASTAKIASTGNSRLRPVRTLIPREILSVALRPRAGSSSGSRAADPELDHDQPHDQQGDRALALRQLVDEQDVELDPGRDQLAGDRQDDRLPADE